VSGRSYSWQRGNHAEGLPSNRCFFTTLQTVGQLILDNQRAIKGDDVQNH